MDHYGTPEGFTAYHEARNRDVSEFSGVSVVAALLVASEWLDAAYLTRFGGRRVASVVDQVREWPRYDAYDVAGHSLSYVSVPVQIEHATYEVALRYLQDNTVLHADYTPNKYKRVSIDGAMSVDFNMLDASSAQKQFPIVGAILAPILGVEGWLSPLSSGTTRA